MPNYTYTNLKDAILSDTSTVSNILALVNRAAREVAGELDLRSLKREAQLSPSIYKQVYTYGAPSSMKDNAIIDIFPQANRNYDSELELVPVDEFDRGKESFKNIVAVKDRDFLKKLLIALPIDTNEIIIHGMDSITGDGTWAASGHASNLELDSQHVINGSASLKFDVAINFTSALLTNSTMEAIDLTDYNGNEIFLWLYIPAVDGISSVKVRLGSSASDYYEFTATTDNEGAAFHVGDNLIRFTWPTSATGSPDIENIDYCRIEIVGDGSNAASLDWRIDYLVARVGKIHNVLFYSSYPWQTSAGSYIRNSTTSSDLINADEDEFELFVFKGKQVVFADQFLYNDADYWQKQYIIKKEDYLTKNPSERKTLTSVYRLFDTH